MTNMVLGGLSTRVPNTKCERTFIPVMATTSGITHHLLTQFWLQLKLLWLVKFKRKCAKVAELLGNQLHVTYLLTTVNCIGLPPFAMV